ncbi:hypothetical protein [Devosia psychrophila]|uniref:Uncharacterized protein n=1 Tax=Devosia psychrophila TaxID=728005 RepID=A0A0F5PZR6_9HYPH|nr:hypothetical protein [Devosia psychrophila]KKC34090.1 hypothetical protein WH91_04820 [Devosia psychrophila]SFD30169.1 hypothetical protein SAMN04488059_13810 [Devosia psychrophila]
MIRIYSWTEDEDEVALDAVTVGIKSDTRILTVAGLQFGQRDAVVYYPEWQGKGGLIPAAMEGPMPVQSALERAERLCAQHDFKRVVVWLQHQELWDARWGQLALEPGL